MREEIEGGKKGRGHPPVLAFCFPSSPVVTVLAAVLGKNCKDFACFLEVPRLMEVAWTLRLMQATSNDRAE